jgi:hypothetical protein
MATRQSSSPTPAGKRTASTRSKAKRDLAEILAAAPWPADAAGATRAQGLGVDPAVDAWLGLGFPRVVLATDEAMEPCASVAAFEKRYPMDAYTLPREAVALHLAIALHPASALTEAPLDPAGPLPTTGPLDVEKAVRDVLRVSNGRVLQQLEALCGTVEVAEATVDAIVEAAGDSQAMQALEPWGPAVVRAGLAWMLWRVPAPTRARLRASLERAWGSATQHTHRFARSLDVVLHGRAGVERSGSNFNGTLHLGDLVHADDDPHWAAEMALKRLATLRPADREWFDPQLVVLTGREVLEAFRASEAKFQKIFRPAMTQELALFR